MRKKAVVEAIREPERIAHYCGYALLPEVEMVPEGEPFGGTWVISHCCFGRAGVHGYEVRYLLSDNDHFTTRRAAVQAARMRAIRTIDLEEVGSLHLCPFPASSTESRRA
ncbi:MAG TPA: hypothetical protein VMW69_14955 [Spirochaetia bacterium]|nr:hypothetical protein [Spirochaetia bacterium]